MYSTTVRAQCLLYSIKQIKLKSKLDTNVLLFLRFSLTTARAFSFQSSRLNSDILTQTVKRLGTYIERQNQFNVQTNYVDRTNMSSTQGNNTMRIFGVKKNKNGLRGTNKRRLRKEMENK